MSLKCRHPYTPLSYSKIGVYRVYIEDITPVVISYEMTTCVIFCLSYDLSKELFIALKVDIISTKNALLSRTMRLLVPAESVNTCVFLTIFMT